MTYKNVNFTWTKDKKQKVTCLSLLERSSKTMLFFFKRILNKFCPSPTKNLTKILLGLLVSFHKLITRTVRHKQGHNHLEIVFDEKSFRCIQFIFGYRIRLGFVVCFRYQKHFSELMRCCFAKVQVINQCLLKFVCQISGKVSTPNAIMIKQFLKK